MALSVPDCVKRAPSLSFADSNLNQRASLLQIDPYFAVFIASLGSYFQTFALHSSGKMPFDERLLTCRTERSAV